MFSSHRLEIGAGRWARPYKPVSDRICNICNCLEHEYHLVLECQLYDSLRGKYIDQLYWNRPCMYKFVELINSSNFELLSNLAIYVYKAFKVRDGELNFFQLIIVCTFSLIILLYVLAFL